MASPDHAATVRAMTHAIRTNIGFALAEKNIPREPTWTLIVPQELDNIDAALDALVAALAQAEHERDEERERFGRHVETMIEPRILERAERAERQRDRAIEALRAIHTSPTCFIDCSERVGAVLATLNPHAA